MTQLEALMYRMNPEVFNDTAEEESDGDSPPVYQEDIPNEFARELLGEVLYDPKCKYQLIQDMNEIAVLKIDESISEEEEKAAMEKDPNTTHVRMLAIPLEVNPGEVMTYGKMRQECVIPTHTTPVKPSAAIDLELMEKANKYSSNNTVRDVTIGILLGLLFLGIMLIIYTLGGG